MVVPQFINTLEQTELSMWLRGTESFFGFYFVLLLHTIGLSMLVGANSVVDMRILGVVKGVPLKPLKKLFKIMWVGLGINAVTGVLLVISYPTKSLTNFMFYIKLSLIALALFTMQRLKTRIFDDESLSEDEMVAKGKTLAKWSLVLWIGAISGGRLLAYTYTYLLYGLYGSIVLRIHL